MALNNHRGRALRIAVGIMLALSLIGNASADFGGDASVMFSFYTDYGTGSKYIDYGRIHCVQVVLNNNQGSYATGCGGSQRIWLDVGDTFSFYAYSTDNSVFESFIDGSRNTITSNPYTGIITESQSSFSVNFRLDKTPPEVLINNPINGMEYFLNQHLIANWSARDAMSGIASATGTTPNGGAIDTTSVGTKTFTVEATDDAGNSATKTVSYHVIYNYSGILQPINTDGGSVFKLGSTIPVKFQLKDANGNYISNAVAKIYVAKIEDVPTNAAITGDQFIYHSADNQYVFNLGTKTLSAGRWQIRIELDDETSKYVTVSLK